MSDKIEVIEDIKSISDCFIKNPILDGFYAAKFRENMLVDENEETVNHIMANSSTSLNNLVDPNFNSEEFNNIIKVLCLGKVQSGKTSYFLSTIAYAFDNGYDVAYILGGTKIRLKEQNFDRVSDSFKNNPKVKIFDVNKEFDEDIRKYVDNGYKVILVILKNAAEFTNLGKLKDLSNQYSDLSSLIVDDEGDEYTPGAERARKKNSKAGKTHDKIVDIINNFKTCSFLSVTATPQANLLVSTYDGISPNRLILVRPGYGYTGGHAFFDTSDNPHVVRINDNDDFNTSIPDSFKDALNFFILGCLIKRTKGDFKPLSMLVHPSSFNAIQNIVASRINNYMNKYIMPALNRGTIQNDDLVEELKKALDSYHEANNGLSIDFDSILGNLNDVIEQLEVQVINHTNTGDDNESDKLYRIMVGGNMLGRGLTINRLTVSYIYRDSKEAQVDTMYQRCRWFGYKKKYFDICRVYMTKELQNKFIAIVSNEDHMWNAMESFLESEINFKKFKRVFVLENDKLVLTRRTVSNTITLKVISSGNRADECIDLSDDDKKFNKSLLDAFINKYYSKGNLIDFDNSETHNQKHLVIKMKFTDFYREFLFDFKFGYGSPFSKKTFSILNSRIEDREIPDSITVLVMRYGKGELRSPSDSTMMTITRLFQGRNDGTSFTGDRYPVDINDYEYSNDTVIQIHSVYLNQGDSIEDSFPLIAFNNPYSSKTIKLVTGDNNYEQFD